MSQTKDHDGNALFAEDHQHATINFGGTELDVIKTNGNLWLSGSETMQAMGFQQHKSGGHGRRLQRIDHPDIIKISDTPFRFSDGRRNRGSFISPRAVLKFAEGGTQGFNPIMANAFVEWMKETLFPNGSDAEALSPAKKHRVSLELVFHAIERVVDRDERGLELDPLRPVGVYLYAYDNSPLPFDEVEFCLCGDERDGLGKCWCRGRGGIRKSLLKPYIPYDGDEVIDLDDDGSTPWRQTPTRNDPTFPVSH